MKRFGALKFRMRRDYPRDPALAAGFVMLGGATTFASIVKYHTVGLPEVAASTFFVASVVACFWGRELGLRGAGPSLGKRWWWAAVLLGAGCVAWRSPELNSVEIAFVTLILLISSSLVVGGLVQAYRIWTWKPSPQPSSPHRSTRYLM